MSATLSTSTASLRLPKSRHELASEDFDAIRGIVTRRVEAHFGARWGEHVEVSSGPPILDYYSLCFPLYVKSSVHEAKLFGKCPKTDLTSTRPLYPFSPQDREMAAQEVGSLKRLSSEWRSEERGADFVHLHLYIEEANCLVLDLIEGEEFYKFARRADRERNSAFNQREASAVILSRVGGALRNFHGNGVSASWSPEILTNKVERYCAAIFAEGYSRKKREGILTKWKEVAAKVDAREVVPSLKGLDIRNILVNERLLGVLIDPGKIKTEPREADLGRFLATLRLLYWGSADLFTGKIPRKELEGAFLAAYGRESISPNLLKLYFVKELLKHWCMGYSALSLKRYPAPVRGFLRRFYIDRFFESQVFSELSEIE